MHNEQPIVLAMDVTESEFKFASSIESAIAMADCEFISINETIRSVNALKPSCDKLDYALAASSGAICGLIDIFLVGKPGESPMGNIGDGWFEDRVTDFARLNGWPDDSDRTAIKFLEDKFKVPYDQTGRGAASEIFGLTPSSHHFKSLGHNPPCSACSFQSWISSRTGPTS